MEKENCLVKVQSEDGKTFDMLILKEFEYKNKKYAVLTEIDSCHCGEECDCDDECECGCQDGKECTCNEECHCNDDCGCEHHECSCEEESLLCLLEITKDKDGNEIFKSIDDEKMFDELVKEADKILYED